MRRKTSYRRRVYIVAIYYMHIVQTINIEYLSSFDVQSYIPKE